MKFLLNKLCLYLFKKRWRKLNDHNLTNPGNIFPLGSVEVGAFSYGILNVNIFNNNQIQNKISIGNFVVSGGELPAAVLCDSIIRLLPGIIGDESSALSDTFQDDLLSAPIYTRPEVYKGLQVPKVLLSGNDKEIQKWNDEKSLERTKLLRPNLFDNE